MKLVIMNINASVVEAEKPFVELADVTFGYDNRESLKNLSIQVKEGEQKNYRNRLRKY